MKKIRILGGNDIEEIKRIEKETMQQVPRLSSHDIDSLQQLWPSGNALKCVMDQLIQHGDYNIFVDPAVRDYSISGDERWASRLRVAAEKLLGRVPNMNALCVDLISSNTHSVLNLLSPYVHKKYPEILSWGRENHPDVFSYEGKDTNQSDSDMLKSSMLYPLLVHWFNAFPEEINKRKEMEAQHGIVEVQEKDVTGVSVQLIDLNKLKRAKKKYNFEFDPCIPFPDSCRKPSSDSAASNNCTDSEECFKPSENKHILVNIDYCFGKQAENIMRSLCLIFGKCVRSVNILGKAGALVGNRGDILFPTHLLDESAEGAMLPSDNTDVDPDSLCELSNRPVHIGPVITVEGTLLQNKNLLYFYERLWHAVGMEMEGSFYRKAIDQAKMLGILGRHVKVRMLYYVSDTPLKPESSLSQKMGLYEGVPPLYAITRMILAFVLETPAPQKEEVTPENVSFSIGGKRKNWKRKWKSLKTCVRLSLNQPKKLKKCINEAEAESPRSST